MKAFRTEMSLRAEDIDRSSLRIEEFLAGVTSDRREILRIRIAAENVLLRWQEHFGEEKRILLAGYSSLGQPVLALRLSDDPFDPLAAEGEDCEADAWSRKLLSGLQTTPIYTYSGNTNAVLFKLVRKRRSPLFWLLAAVAAAVLAGLAGFLLPADFRSAVGERLMSPIANTYIQVLNFFGIPLIFLSVANGISGIGDASAFGKIGKKMMSHFGLSLLASAALAALLAMPFFRFSFGANGAAMDYDAFLDMVLGFLPTGIVTPFVECNAMQLIIMGALFGTAMLGLNPVAARFCEVMEGVDSVLVRISQWFTRLLPIFVFLILVRGIWSGELSALLPAWKFWLVTTALQLLLLLLTVAQIALRHRVSVLTVLRKCFSTFLIAFGTNSCTSAIPEIYDCSAKLGIHSRVMGMGIPIGTSAFKPNTAIRFVVLAYFLASSYQISVSTRWFLLAALLAVILSVAVPAIPGGALIFYPMFFTQLGLPAEAMTAMLAMDILFDAPCTAFNQVSCELALAQQAGRLRILDEEALRKQ